MKRLQRLNLPTCRQQQSDCEGQGFGIGKDTMAFNAVSNIKNALSSLESYRGPSEEWGFSEVGLGSL